MPAYRLTANSIWSSFRSSGKQHLILTGTIGSGKTTLLSTLFPSPLPGITTWAEPCKAVFMRDNLTGASVKIADYDASIQGTEAKMSLCCNELASFGVAALERCIQDNSDWVSIDEIGFLEENCKTYQNAIRHVFEQKHVVAVVRKQDLTFLNELRSRDDAFLVDLDVPFGNSSCVIMASGLGKRFGDNKLMADFLGKPMITRILDATEGLFRKRVVVTRHENVAELCRDRDVLVVLHDLPHRSDTVRLGLKAVGDTERCMFCPGDQPLLSKDTIAALLLCAVNKPETIWRTCYDQIPGSPVLFPKWAFSELLTLPTGKGGGMVIEHHPENLCMMRVSDPRELMDADTPEALDEIKRSMR